MIEARIYTINPNHRGNRRLWIEGEPARKAGFESSKRFEIVPNGNGIVLQVIENGSRKVAAKESAHGPRPIIDINNTEALKPLEGCSSVRVLFGNGKIYVSPLASELRRLRRLKRLKSKLENNQHLSTAGVCSGGGVLSHAVHAGLKEGGIDARLHAFNEIREDLVNQASKHNEIVTDKTILLNLPIQELAFDASVMDRVGEVDILELGLPCSAASSAGKAKNKNSMMESHEHVGHLVIAGLAVIARLNPAVVIFENVPPYANTASAELIRKQLVDFGYTTHERVLDAHDFDTLEKRIRWSLVAVTRGIEFNFDDLELLGKPDRKLSEIFEAPEAVKARWSPMEGLKAKEQRDLKVGKNFRMQTFTGKENYIGTLTKGIAKNRSTDPKFVHPEDPTLLRIPTAIEHARCKGIPEHLIEGMPGTTAHELLGQAVCWNPFKQIGKLVAKAIKEWSSQGEIQMLATTFCSAA